MKKYIVFGIVLCLILSACTNSTSDESNKPYASNKTTTQSENEPVTVSPSPLSKPTDTPTERPNEDPTETVISSVTTKIYDKSKGRQTNIKLSSNKISGKVIPPGEEFSFNKTVGPRTLKRGYKKGYIFDDGEKIIEIGGGICQVSSTIYCAAKKAGLEILERHEHSLDVPYVEKGDDATVFYGTFDFRFRNTTENNLRVDVLFDKKTVNVKLVSIQ